ncbi:MAG: polysaccharide biosynthesis/export family protein [Acidobacteriota bacterium]
MLYVAIILLTTAQALAQDRPLRPEGLQLAERQQDYQVGPADVLSVSILGVRAFDLAGSGGLVVNVSNSGKIRLPYLGVLRVAGMTTSQLEGRIAERLREKSLVMDAQVLVQVVDYRAQNVYILGEVMQPGQYLLRDDMYVADLVSLGMGFNEVSSRFVYLYRHSSTSSGTGHSDWADPAREASLEEAIRIDVRAVLNGNRPDLNLKLRGGDILYCPQHRPERYYVVGAVMNPGAMEIPVDNQQVLASQAIAFAGGPSRTAKMSKGLVITTDEKGRRQELAVDFNGILKGRKPDFVVKANDIIFIPGSEAKTLGYGLLGIVPGIASRSVIF